MSEHRMTTEGNTQIAQEGAHQGSEKKSRLFLFLVGIAVVLVIIGIFTLLQRREQYNALAKETEKSAIPTVAVIHPTVEPSQESTARKSISSFLRRVPTSAPCKPMKIFLASPPHVLKN